MRVCQFRHSGSRKGSLRLRRGDVNPKALSGSVSMTRIAKYCTHCGEPLVELQRDGRLRPYCNACETLVYFDPKVAVVVFIQRDDRVLLIQRAVDPGRGKWALPAGFVDHDEAPEAAAIRETMEETQLEARIEKLLAVYPKRDEGLADIVIAYSASVSRRNGYRR